MILFNSWMLLAVSPFSARCRAVLTSLASLVVMSLCFSPKQGSENNASIRMNALINVVKAIPEGA